MRKNSNKKTKKINKHISFAAKANIILNLPRSWFSLFNWQKSRNFKICFFSVNYPIIYNTTKLSINCEAGELSLGYFLSSRERLNVVDIIIIIILIYTYIIIS